MNILLTWKVFYLKKLITVFLIIMLIPFSSFAAGSGGGVSVGGGGGVSPTPGSPGSSSTTTQVVSGTISLPAGHVAPEGGIVIDVETSDYIQVTIREGESSASYSIECRNRITFIPQNNSHGQIIYKEVSVRNPASQLDITLEACYTVYGTITLEEALEDGFSLDLVAHQGRATRPVSETCYVGVKAGSTAVNYLMILKDVSVGDNIYVTCESVSLDEKYLSFDPVTSDSITISGYATECDFSIPSIKKAAEVIKGTVSIPDVLKDEREGITISAISNSCTLTTTIRTDRESSSFDFCLYGETDNISDYLGKYTLEIALGDYTRETLYYYNGNLSLTDYSYITVSDTVVVPTLQIPAPNTTFSGNIILSEATQEDTTVILSLYDEDNSFIAKRKVEIPEGSSNYPYSVEFLTKDGVNCVLSYQVDRFSDYYDCDTDLFVKNGSYTTVFDEASLFNSGKENTQVNISLSPLYYSAFIEGTISLPPTYVPDSDDDFSVDLKLSNGERTLEDYISFYGGETSNDYSFKIADMYSGGNWTLSYIVGDENGPEDEGEYIPSIPHEIILDTDFYVKPFSSSGGSSYPREEYIPDEVTAGMKFYYTSTGLSLKKDDAKVFTFNNGGFSNVDFSLYSTDNDYQRIISGYFLSTVRDISFTAELIDYETNQVVDTFGGKCAEEATKYTFDINRSGYFIIKFSYENKEYYYADDNNLTTEKEDALVIDATSYAYHYDNNVYYENIKEHKATTNDRYLRFIFEHAWFDGFKACLFDLDGNMIAKSEEHHDELITDQKAVYIGYEWLGQIHYFSSLYSDRENILYGSVRNIKDATAYTLPHVSARHCDVILDVSDFVRGKAVGLEDDVYVYESYFNYEETGDGDIYVDSLYIDISPEVFDGSNMLFTALYNAQGKILSLIPLTQSPEGNCVSVDKTIPRDGYAKVVVLKPSLNPVFEPLNYTFTNGL